MQDQRDLGWLFAPLDNVPHRTFARVVDKLRRSRDGGERALGIFLDRVMAYQEGKAPRTRPAPNPRDPKLSSLRDLRD